MEKVRDTRAREKEQEIEEVHMCMYIHMYLHTHAHISLYAHTYTSMQTVASGQWWSIGSASGPAGTMGTALSW